MLQSPLSRVAGPFALVAGGLFVAAQVLLFATLEPANKLATVHKPLFAVAQVGYFLGFCMLLLALFAAYQWESSRAGMFGVIAFCAAVIGTMFLAGDLWFDTFAGPWIIMAAPDVANNPTGSVVAGAFVSYALFAIGWVLFGLASLQARVFPRLISVAIMVGGAVGFLALLPPFGIPLGLAMIALGTWMIRAPVPRTVDVPATA
jgi:hypothetical protein